MWSGAEFEIQKVEIMIRRLFKKLKLIKPRQPHLPQTNVSGSLHSAMNEIENAMERWHLARDNDDETLEEINRILVSIGRLGWFNRNDR